MAWISAPAKINLGLWVGSRDETGYHPIDTVMQTVALSDQLMIDVAQEMHWESSEANLPMDRQNLVVRAYRWYHETVAPLPLATVRLEKRIPAGAGLGGGSSDAAAMIRWATDASPVSDLHEITCRAADIGKDVPFFIKGGTARVSGYGEAITSMPATREMGVVLVNPGIPVATDAVYRAFDEVGKTSKRAFLERIIEALREGLYPSQEHLINDLEDPAFHVLPALRSFREVIVDHADRAPVGLSGSGPTYFILGENREWAEWMAGRMARARIPWVRPTTLLGSW